MNANDGPLEVWLRQDEAEITCTVVRDDESTYELDVDSLSMRGAQREMTGYFIAQATSRRTSGRSRLTATVAPWRRCAGSDRHASRARPRAVT